MALQYPILCVIVVLRLRLCILVAQSSTILSACSLSRPLPTSSPLSRPLPIPRPSSLSIRTYFPSLHQPRVLPLSALPAYTSALFIWPLFICLHVYVDAGCCLLIRDLISRLLVRVQMLLCCCLRITIAIVIVGSRSGCSCYCCGVLVAYHGEGAPFCNCDCRSPFHCCVLLSVCHNCHYHCHCRIAFRL